jgi:hypothetical protein
MTRLGHLPTLDMRQIGKTTTDLPPNIQTGPLKPLVQALLTDFNRRAAASGRKGWGEVMKKINTSNLDRFVYIYVL